MIPTEKKTMLQNLEGQTKTIVVFSKVAHCTGIIKAAWILEASMYTPMYQLYVPLYALLLNFWPRILRFSW